MRGKVAGLGVALSCALSACTPRLPPGNAKPNGNDDEAGDTATGGDNGNDDETSDAGETGETGDPIDCGSFSGCDRGPVEDDCDFWMQDCPTGEKCTPIASTPGSAAWDNHVCVPAGDAAIGEPCTKVDGPPGTDSCDAESICYDIDHETGIGTCVGFCLGSRQDPSCPEASGPFAACRLLADDYVNVCVPRCNPLLAGECPTGQTCVAAYEGQELGGFTCSAPAAEGLSGEACTCANCCAAHHMCVTADEYGPNCAFDLCCTEYCDTEDASFTCQGTAQVCVTLFDPNTPEFGNVGRCVLP